MDDLQLTIVSGYRVDQFDLDLSSPSTAWRLALEQRTFGPRRLIVLTATSDGQVLGLAHCGQTDPPEAALQCCLDTLDDQADAAVAFSDEFVDTCPPPGLADRLADARAAAATYGVHLVDWLICDDMQFRSMRYTLEDFSEWWDLGWG